MGGTVLLPGCNEVAPKKVVPFETPQYIWGKVSGQTLTMRGNRDNLFRSYMLKTVERYEKLTGNKVRLEGFTHQDFVKNIAASFLRGSEEKPDIIYTSGGVSFENMDGEKNFYDFTQALWVDDLTDTAINQSIYNGKVMGLPYGEASVSGILYNKELFKKYGLRVPRDQREFLALCATLLQKGITPVYLPYAERTMLLYQFPLGSVVEDNKTLETLNNGVLSYTQIPEMKKIVSWYKTMSDQGYFGQDYVHNDWAGMDSALKSGKYAMMICWDTWLYTHFTGDPSAFGLMPAFMGVPDEGTFEGPNLMLLVVNKHSPRLEAVLDFITFVADPYNYTVNFSDMYTAPVFKNQVGSLSTPQYVQAQRLINRLFRDATASLRIRGFSQLDSVYIQKHMRDKSYSVEDCLRDMDSARRQRASYKH